MKFISRFTVFIGKRGWDSAMELKKNLILKIP
jgi:hypothetical protein